MSTESIKERRPFLYRKYRDDFDKSGWMFPDMSGVLDKLREEVHELAVLLDDLECRGDMGEIPESVMDELADIAIMAFTVADFRGQDFDNVVARRARNNIERLHRAKKATEFLCCSVEDAWRICSRMEEEFPSSEEKGDRSND